MIKTFKVRFTHGVFKPLEKVDIKEGTEITVTILETPPKKKKFLDALESIAGGWKDTIDCEELIKNIYADCLISTRKIPKL